MDIVAMGELLIDFTSVGKSNSGMNIFEQNPGGAPANVAACVARLGGKAGFIGKVGDDMHGRFLKETLDNADIETKGLILSPDYFTTLAFVSLAETGERTFSFARKPGADTMITKDEVCTDLIKDAKVLSVGSLSLTDEPAKSALHFAVETAKANGTLVAYDPNYRAPLWKTKEDAVREMRSLLKDADLIKISDEETALLTDSEAPEDAIVKLTDCGIKVACVTLGADGALVRAKGETVKVPGFKTNAVDTTGAGDSFWGGFIYAMLNSGKDINDITAEDAAAFARFGNAAAACCVKKTGAIPAMPTIDDVNALLG